MLLLHKKIGRLIRYTTSFTMLFIVLLYSGAEQVHAQSLPLPHKQVIMLCVEGLDTRSLLQEHLPHLKQLAVQGSVGMMKISQPPQMEAQNLLPTESRQYLYDKIHAYGGHVAVITPNRSYPFDKLLRSRSDLIIIKIDRPWGTLNDVDAWIGRVSSSLNKNRLLVVTALPSDVTFSRVIPPFILAGGEIPSGHWLSSSTTKRDGLITNYDIAPTMLRFFGFSYDHRELQGQPIVATSSHKDNPTHLSALNLAERSWAAVEIYRQPLLWGYVTVLIFSLILLTGMILFRRPIKSTCLIIDKLVEILLWIPISFLCLGLLQPQSVWEAVWVTIGIASFCMICTGWIDNFWMRKWLIATSTLGLLTVDTLLHEPLLKMSVLGSSPFIGARYYGIGNEAMGIWLGALFLFLMSIRQLRSRLHVSFIGSQQVKWLGAIMLLLTVYLLAAPQYGSNAGGGLAVAAGLGYWLIYPIRRFTLQKMVFLLLCIAGGMIAIAELHIIQKEVYPTHISLFVEHLQNRQYELVWTLICRKGSVLLHLLWVSPWSKLFLVLLGCSVWQSRTIQLHHPDVFRVIHAGIACSMAAFLFNDSGVLAGAGVLLFQTVTILSYKLLFQRTMNEENEYADEPAWI